MQSSRAIPIVALDVPDATRARQLVDTLGDDCTFYKVGLELFAAEGPSIVRWLRDRGKDVFVDLKLHDIPNTVQSAARAVASLGAALLTVHASGGVEMIAAAVEGFAEGKGSDAGGILAVTVLTSHSAASQARAWGRELIDVDSEVVRLAGEARAAEARGIVCSGHEARAVRKAHGDALRLLIPGIRFADGELHDQQRIMTPSSAQTAGADWIILGRAVTGSTDPREAMHRVHMELSREP